MDRRAYTQWGKRLLDVLLASLALLVFAPLLISVALCVRVWLGAPVLFRQQRPGLRGQPFILLKFRTMTDGRDGQGRLLPDAERLTAFGRFLRSTSLDELPELLNVLKGDMSVVGPRPHMLKHTQDFSAEVNKFMSRHKIKPGITGLAQAKGFRGETDELEKKITRVKLDLFYMNNWSFFFDLKIIAATIWELLKPVRS